MKAKKEFLNNCTNLLYLKQVFSIISEYNGNKKTIMFLGVPLKIINNYERKIFKSKHIFIPENYWTKGLLTNKSSFSKGLKNERMVSVKNLHVRKYLARKKKPNLLIIFNHENKLEILKETTKLKIPVVSLFDSNGSNYVLYPIISNENKIRYNHLIFYLLISLFKRKNLRYRSIFGNQNPKNRFFKFRHKHNRIPNKFNNRNDYRNKTSRFSNSKHKNNNTSNNFKNRYHKR